MATVEVVDVPDRVDFRVLAGRPFSALLPILTGPAAAPTPVEAGDIASVRAHVRAGIDSELVVHVFTTDDGSAVIVGSGSAAASVRLVADSAETTEWQLLWPGSAPETVVWWDLEITDTGGERHQVTSPGQIVLVHQVTR